MKADQRGLLVRAEARKVCERGHTQWGWRPWYRMAGPMVLGHCMCGAAYRLETRGPEPLSQRGLGMAGDALALEAPSLPDADTERIAEVVVRAYLNELERWPEVP